MEPAHANKNRRRGIYFLPNLLTTAALFAGFYAIVAATQSKFEIAAIAIFVAMILDGLDGRVARWTNTQSDFGAQYDSLSDMVSFGLAPALVMYEWVLHSMGKVGWVAAFIYTAAAALRLARFNTQVGVADKRYFQGLPSPSAAAMVTAFVWLGHVNDVVIRHYSLAAMILTVVAGLLMVSNIRYHSFKGFDVRSKVPFIAVVAVVLTIAVLNSDPPLMLFVGFLLYALSGPVLTLWQLQRKRRARRKGGANHDNKQDLEKGA
jgi:CDP-diacylglycerol--serine O-phosphatidyltransferase